MAGSVGKLAENLRKMGLSNLGSSTQTTRKLLKTVRAPITFSSKLPANPAPTLAANVSPQRNLASLPPTHPQAIASDAARDETDPYTFNYVLQFEISGYDRETLIKFEGGKQEYAATPSVKNIIKILQIPHFRAHSYSKNTTKTTTTRYYVNKATYLHHLEQNLSLKSFTNSVIFMAFDIPPGERSYALRMGDKLRAEKAGGRRVKRKTRVKRTKKYKTRKYRG
jgi:hypothetical protein